MTGCRTCLKIILRYDNRAQDSYPPEADGSSTLLLATQPTSFTGGFFCRFLFGNFSLLKFLSMFCVYILFSVLQKKIYVGYTQSNIARFHSHNHFAKKGYTVRYRPWKMICTEFYDNKLEALAREKFLKSGVRRKMIHDRLSNMFEDYIEI